MYAVDEESVAAVLTEVADRRDATTRQVALAWLLDHSDVTLPIPGTSSVDHLESNLAAAELSLTDEDMAALNEIDPQE
jgi:aryl-alcohol dehydrogenase-like predicted oxidoreductase